MSSQNKNQTFDDLSFLILLSLFRVLYFNIRGVHANLYESAVAGSDYDVLICAESKVSDPRHLSDLNIAGFGCPEQNSTPRAQGMALDVREGFHRFCR